MRKEILTQARVDGVVIHDTTTQGKAHKGAALISACEAITASGRAGEVRQREGNAQGWAVYSYAPGDRCALLMPRHEWGAL